MNRINKQLKTVLFGSCLFACAPVFSQELPGPTEQQLEARAEGNEETLDEQELSEREQLRRQPVNLNTASADELRLLPLLTEEQIENLLRYRDAFGKLISVYELQAVPRWDLASIRLLLPFVTVDTLVSLLGETSRRWRGGEHSVVFRGSRRMEGYNQMSGMQSFQGGRARLFLRYQYRKGTLLQYGFTAEKDEGERFFAGAQKLGFDFYSAHLFLRNLGHLKQLAVGDFTVNLGQGLIHWQGMNFGKSVSNIRRQAPLFRPHSSAGEFNFHRGAAVSVNNGPWEAGLFFSVRRLSANTVFDSMNQRYEVTSLISSGLHRTAGEVEDRHRLTRWSAGGTLKLFRRGFHFAINAVGHSFSVPLTRKKEPHQAFTFTGRRWGNLSFDYAGTLRNMHVFGEVAMDRNESFAVVQGLLVTPDPRADLAIHFRHIPKQYQAHLGNAFTENHMPANETGIFAGITLRPAAGWQLDMFADLFSFPWLKYGVDAPANGMEFSMQLTYTPAKGVEACSRLRVQLRPETEPIEGHVTGFLRQVSKRGWRSQVSYRAGSHFLLRYRIEMLWHDTANRLKTGLLSFIDVHHKVSPLLSFTGRIQYFDTDGYGARVYVFEYDIASGPAVPAFYDAGLRYYLVLRYEPSQRLSAWLRWAQTIYNGTRAGERRSELGLQVRWLIRKGQ
ncbi:MAG TPA: helix-hairpin-helix domain-containing protein [Chitinophagaceae bacterium]|nr:helix-hairpin-helix domain-containing protein [Chitinophagaceae bacterium]